MRRIKELYGFAPCPRRVAPRLADGTLFGVRRLRTFTDQELNESEFLSIDHVEAEIGIHKRGTIEQANADQYVAKLEGKQRTVPLGMLTPFRQICASSALKCHLENSGVYGAKFEPVVNLEGRAWKLSSNVTLPRSLIPMQNGKGEDVAADVWGDQWDDKYFDDSGYLPVELKYERAEVERLSPFDIAATFEREGLRFSASRYLVVSQKFRSELESFGAQKVRYTPVRLV